MFASESDPSRTDSMELLNQWLKTVRKRLSSAVDNSYAKEMSFEVTLLEDMLHKASIGVLAFVWSWAPRPDLDILAATNRGDISHLIRHFSLLRQVIQDPKDEIVQDVVESYKDLKKYRSAGQHGHR